MEDWKYVAKDGNPEKEGVYDCVLIWEERKAKDPGKEGVLTDDNFESTGRVLAFFDSRYFGPAEKYEGWIMKDQPNEGLVWTEECGSYSGERVYAWLPARLYPDIELPEGVEWKDD